MGSSDERLRELLTDVLGEFGLALHASRTGGGTPALVLVIVGKDDLEQRIEEARKIAAKAPLVAIFSFSDPRQERCSIALGVSATYALDAPLQRLRAEILRLIRDGRPFEAPKPFAFRLGRHALAAMSAIRKNRYSWKNQEEGLPADIEHRLEQGIELDLVVDEVRGRSAGSRLEQGQAFTFGAHALVEIMMLRLSTFEASLLEQAIGADLARKR